MHDIFFPLINGFFAVLKNFENIPSILEMLGNLRVIRKSLMKNWESSEVFGLVNSWAVWPLTTIFGVPGVFLAVSRVFRGIMGCSRGVPGLFRAVPGCSGGVPGVFRGVPGVFRGVPGCSGCVPGFTDTRFTYLFYNFMTMLIENKGTIIILWNAVYRTEFR